MGGLFFALMYLVGATSVVFEPWNGSRFWMLFELFADLYVVCLLLMLLPSRWRGVGRVVCAAATYLLSAVDMACYVRVGMPITPMLVQLVMQTNGREATEALVAYADGRMLLSPLSLVLAQAVVGLWCLCRPSACQRVLSRLSARVPLWLWDILRMAVLLLLLVGVASSAENKAYLYYRIVRQYSELDTQRRAMTDALPHLLYHLAGIHTPWYHARYDLLSPHYDAHRPRIIRGERDYDRLKSENFER